MHIAKISVLWLCGVLLLGTFIDVAAKHKKNQVKAKKISHKNNSNHRHNDSDHGCGNEVTRPLDAVFGHAVEYWDKEHQAYGCDRWPARIRLSFHVINHFEIGVVEIQDLNSFSLTINVRLSNGHLLTDTASKNFEDLCEFGAEAAVVTHDITEEDVTFAFEAITSLIHEDETGPLQHDCGNKLMLKHPHHTPDTGHTELVSHGYIKTFQIDVYEKHFKKNTLSPTVSIFVNNRGERSLEVEGVHPEPCSITASNHEGLYDVCAEDFETLSAGKQKVCRMHKMFEHNKNPNYSWKMTYYKNLMEKRFGGTTHQGTAILDSELASDPPPADGVETLLASAKLSLEDVWDDIPSSYNFLDAYPECFFPALDMGECRADWAFAATGAFEKIICKTSVDGGYELHKPRLSRQQTVECGVDSLGCHGGSPENGWWSLAMVGGVRESSHSYTSGSTGKPRTLNSCGVPRLGSDYCVEDRPGKKYFNVPIPGYEDHFRLKQVFGSPMCAMQLWSAEHVKAALLEYGPVTVAFRSEEFPSYSSGILSCPPDDRPYWLYSAQIIGWGVDDKGTEYWILEHSFGSSWGENRNMEPCPTQSCDGDFCILSSEDERASQCGYFRVAIDNDCGMIGGDYLLFPPLVSRVDPANLEGTGEVDADEPHEPEPEYPTCEHGHLLKESFWGEDPYAVEYEVSLPGIQTLTGILPISVRWRAPLSRSKYDLIVVTNAGECVPLSREYVSNGFNGCDIWGTTVLSIDQLPPGSYDVTYVSVRKDNVGSVRAVERAIATFTIDPGHKCTPTSECIVQMYLGNGRCEDMGNNAECCYDLGDCCVTTCVDSTYECSGYSTECRDPNAPY